MYIVELQWLEHLCNHEKMVKTGVPELMSVNRSPRTSKEA